MGASPPSVALRVALTAESDGAILQFRLFEDKSMYRICGRLFI